MFSLHVDYGLKEMQRAEPEASASATENCFGFQANICLHLELEAFPSPRPLNRSTKSGPNTCLHGDDLPWHGAMPGNTHPFPFFSAQPTSLTNQGIHCLAEKETPNLSQGS